MADDELPATVMAATLARVWGITTERVRQLAKEGHIPAGERGRYPCAATLLAFAKYQREVALQARSDGKTDRIKAARAREIELRIAQKEREVIRLDEALPSIDTLLGFFIASLNGFPARFTRDRDLRARLEEGLNGVLTKLAARCRKTGADLRAGRALAEAVEEDDAGSMGEGQPDLPGKRRRSRPKRPRPDPVQNTGGEGDR